MKLFPSFLWRFFSCELDTRPWCIAEAWTHSPFAGDVVFFSKAIRGEHDAAKVAQRAAADWDRKHRNWATGEPLEGAEMLSIHWGVRPPTAQEMSKLNAARATIAKAKGN